MASSSNRITSLERSSSSLRRFDTSRQCIAPIYTAPTMGYLHANGGEGLLRIGMDLFRRAVRRQDHVAAPEITADVDGDVHSFGGCRILRRRALQPGVFDIRPWNVEGLGRSTQDTDDRVEIELGDVDQAVAVGQRVRRG